MPTNLRVLLLCLIALALLTAPAVAAERLVIFDFEDGTLQGWTIESGQAGTLPTGPGTARSGHSFGQQGSRFIGLYENPEGDKPTIVLRSPEFTIQADTISLLVGGGNHPSECYVALYKASDNSEIARESGHDTEYMTRRFWDVSKLKGTRVYLKIVDSHTGGWGHINVDDIHELTPAEERARAKDLAEKAKRYDRWLASIDTPAKRIVRKGDALKDIAMPLGGIGGGHVSICGDGAVRQWCIFNRVNEACVVPNSFFAIYTRYGSRRPVARLLQQTPIGKMPAVKSVEFIGEYPIAEVKFVDSSLPVRVSLRAFSPHIPTNAKDSAIPAAVFEFTIENRIGQPVEVSLLSVLQNAVGYDGVSSIDGVANKDYGGNSNTVFADSGLRGVLLENLSLKPDARQFGTMAVGARHENARVVEQWDDLAKLWNTFSRQGIGLSQGGSPSDAGRTWNAGVAVPVVVMPRQKVTIPFVWSWCFPNMINEWQGGNQGRIGRMYTNWFKDAAKAAGYVSANYDRLAGDTTRFRDTFYMTTLPYWMLDRIGAQSSTLASTVCMWLEDGSFAAFEGAGCCPMNCNHVWNYEQQMAHLFPDLERIMRKIDLVDQLQADGGVRHRTRFPLSEPRDHWPAIDGQLGTILKTYREYRQSPDRAWLDKYWPKVKLAMQYAFAELDPNRDGVIVASQFNTYDATMYGPNTFIGSLYLAALRACEEMAKVEGDQQFAQEVRSAFDLGTKRLDDALWTGEYWRQIETKPKPEDVKGREWLLEDWPVENPDGNRPYGKGCHADQLLGQWWATQLGLGYVLPKEHVNTALNSIMKFNWIKDFGEVIQTPRAFVGIGEPGLYICTWPYGEKPPVETLYSFEDWTGIDYEVAGLLIQEGRPREAYQIVKTVSDRYDGVPRGPIQRNPFAEVECSNHYARAMASWGMLLAAQGYRYCGPDQSIGFDPVVSPENHASFFTGAEGWGLFTQRRSRNSQEDALGMEYGRLYVKKLTLSLPPSAADACKAGTVRISLDPRFGSFTPAFDGTSVTLELAQPALVVAGEKLAPKFEW